MIDESVLKKMHNGMIASWLFNVLNEMPELEPILRQFPDKHGMSKYLFDVKVHMLMPNQYPCIPNWHRDFVPRDESGNLLEDKIDKSNRMFLWISGDPLPEFKNRVVRPQEWFEFGQDEWQRGTVSNAHQWRLFIRAVPRHIVPESVQRISGVRRHSQVYLDASEFVW